MGCIRFFAIQPVWSGALAAKQEEEATKPISIHSSVSYGQPGHLPSQEVRKSSLSQSSSRRGKSSTPESQPKRSLLRAISNWHNPGASAI